MLLSLRYPLFNYINVIITIIILNIFCINVINKITPSLKPNLNPRHPCQWYYYYTNTLAKPHLTKN